MVPHEGDHRVFDRHAGLPIFVRSHVAQVSHVPEVEKASEQFMDQIRNRLRQIGRPEMWAVGID